MIKLFSKVIHKIKNIKTTYWIFSGIIIVSFILIVIIYKANFSVVLQYILGLLLGVVFGAGIIGLILTLRKETWWRDNTNRLNHILLLSWEGFILAFAISYIFPHFKDHVINHLDFLRPNNIFSALGYDLGKFWYGYAFFLFSVIVWIFLIVWYKREKNKYAENLDPNKRPRFFIIFTIVTILFLISLKFAPVVLDPCFNEIKIPRPTVNEIITFIPTENETIILKPVTNETIIFTITENETKISRPTINEIKIYKKTANEIIVYTSTVNETKIYKPTANEKIVFESTVNETKIFKPTVNEIITFKITENETIILEQKPNEYKFFDNNDFIFSLLLGISIEIGYLASNKKWNWIPQINKWF
jgi:hypothetical protein